MLTELDDRGVRKVDDERVDLRLLGRDDQSMFGRAVWDFAVRNGRGREGGGGGARGG